MTSGTFDGSQAASSVAADLELGTPIKTRALRTRRTGALLGIATIATAAGIAWITSSSAPLASTTVREPTPIEVISSSDSRFGRMEQVQLWSDSLDRPVTALVITPPGYADTDELFPTLYLLHDQNESPERFDSLGLRAQLAALQAAGEIGPAVVVLPSIDNSFGVSNAEDELIVGSDGTQAFYSGGDYEGFLVRDLIAAVEESYRVSTRPEDRSIGGLGMGGFAALHTGLRHPGIYGRVGAHSPALVGPASAWLYPDEDSRSTRDPELLASTTPDGALDGVSFYLDFGPGDDDLVEALERLEEALPAGAELYDASAATATRSQHWRQRLAEYLNFYLG